MTRRVVATLLLLTVLLGLATAPALASAPSGSGAAVLAHDDGEGGGFGPGGDVRDAYGNSVYRYEVSGLHQWSLVDTQQGILASMPLATSAIAFSLVKITVVATVWLLKFSLEFGIAELLLTPVNEIIEVYQTFVDALGVVPVALMLCVFWFGLMALRGRIGKGAGEIAVSFVLVVVLGAILAAPGQTLLGEQGLLGRAKDLGGTFAMLAVQDPAVAWRTAECGRVPQDGQPLPDGCYPDDFPRREMNVEDPQVLGTILEVWLVDLFIRQPHQYIVYGHRIDCPIGANIRQWDETPDDFEGNGCQPTSCVHRYNTIIETDRTRAAELIEAAGSSADPNSYAFDMMHPDHGGYGPEDDCDDDEARAMADYVTGGSWGRIAVASMTGLALVVLLLFVLLGVVVPIVVGQVMLAVLTVALVVVLPIALLGNAGRQILWRWFGLLAGGIFMMIVSLFGLSLMLIFTDLLLQTSWHMFATMALVSISSVVFLQIQRKLLKGGMAGGKRLAGSLGTVGADPPKAGAAPKSLGGNTEMWTKPADRLISGAGRLASGAPLWKRLAHQRTITNDLGALERVRDKHPEFTQKEVFRQKEAQAMYDNNPPTVKKWRHKRKGKWGKLDKPNQTNKLV